MPSQTFALEPEQKVGSAVAVTGSPSKRFCTHAADRQRPRGEKLGSGGIQVGIEHCRRRQTKFQKWADRVSIKDRVVAYYSIRCRRGRKYVLGDR